MVSTDIRSATQAARDRRDANVVPQFFISLVNQCPFVLTVQSVEAASACGWVQEPLQGEQIQANAERVWCGMPWDEGTRLQVSIILCAEAGEITLSLTREVRQAAASHIEVHAIEGHALYARAELQRDDAASPFLMVLVHTS